MSFALDQYTGNGVLQTFTVTFPYLDEAHVKVLLDGVEQTQDTDYTFVTPTSIQFTAAPAAGVSIRFRRESNREERLVDHQDASTVTEETLDDDANQMFYVAQEAFDKADDSIALNAAATAYDADEKRIINVADPEDEQDAATKAYGDANWGGTAADAAAASAAAAAASAEAAQDSETLATSAANSASASATAADTSEANAAASAMLAGNSETAAETAQAAAEAARDAALVAETNAETAETNAETAQAAAAASQSAAATSETNAAASASSASTSATNAATSATAAQTAETNAEAAEVAAELAETNAELAEIAAEAAQVAAEAARDAAIAAKNAAETAETNAETAEANAETAETNAETAATNAATSATNAATSATNAANSATAAQTAETNAETAETNAETAEANAEAAQAAAEAAQAAAEAAAGTISNPFRKNAFINGDFNVWQRGTSFAAIANGAFSADRWEYVKVGSMVHTVSQSTDVPTVAQAGRLFNYSLLVDCTTADAAIAAGDVCYLRQKIEGYNWLPIAQREFTISFWVKGTKTGIHCVAVANSGNDRSYIGEYTINAADTWEKKTVTVTASPAAGTWNYTNGIGLQAFFVLACGTDLHNTANQWNSTIDIATANQVNACDSTSNNFRIAGVQLEPGDQATEFEHRTFADELHLCKRYYEKSYDLATAPGTAGVSAGTIFLLCSSAGGSSFVCPIPFKVRKRVAPTMSVYSAGGNSGVWQDSGGTERSVGTDRVGESSAVVSNTSGAAVVGMVGHYVANAEL